MTLVNGVPTKDKKIWQKLFSVQHVKKALGYLKVHNVYYKDIDVEDHVHCVGSQSEKTSGQIEKMERGSSEKIYEHYTIHPLHSKEVVGDAIELFQMKQAKGTPISVWGKIFRGTLFSSSVSNRYGGRYDDQPVQIPASEYRS